MKISIKNGTSFCFSTLVALAFLITTIPAFAAPVAPSPNTSNTVTNSAQAPQQTLIVVDAIGQEKVTKQNKSEILQGIMHEIVTNRTMNLRIGLSRFDSKTTPDCPIYNFYLANIDSSPQSMAEIVGQLFEPTDDPYTLAISQAVAALDSGELESVVVVIGASDGVCVPNPCSVAKQINAANSDFKTEVIGFESTPTQEDGLQCLAKNIQGSYVVAQTPAELKAIMKQKISPLIHSSAEYGSINLAAIAKETGEPLNSDVRWWVDLPTTNDAIQPTVVQFSTQLTPHFQLTPGTYVVKVSYGEFSSMQTITIQSGQVQNITLSVQTH